MGQSETNDTPSLPALVEHYQKLLRLQDWRIEASYRKDLKASDGSEVWGICFPAADAKTARIIIRDPSTPPRGETAEEALRQVTETVVHELCHLHFAAFANRSPAEVIAEEQAVWALAEALVKSQGTPAERTIARAMVARMRTATPSETVERHADAGDQTMMEKKLATEALDALTAGDTERCAEILKSIIVGAASGEAAEGDAPPPPPPGDEMLAEVTDEEKKPEMLAVARLVISTMGKATPGEALEEFARRNRIVSDLERREAELVRSRAVIDASDRRSLVAQLVIAGEPPATAWEPDADGLPDGKTPAEPWASMPLPQLRARAARFAPLDKGARAPTGGGVGGLTDKELEMCRTKKIDPAAYQKTKAAIAERARVNPRGQGA